MAKFMTAGKMKPIKMKMPKMVKGMPKSKKG